MPAHGKTIRHDKPFGGGPPGSIDEKAGRLILLPHAAFFQGIEKLVAQRIDEQTGVADELLQHGLVIFRDRGAGGDRAVDDDGPSRILCQAIEPVLKIFHVRLVEQIILADDDDGIAPVIRIMQMLLQTCADLFRLTDVDGIRIVLILPQQEIDAGVLSIGPLGKDRKFIARDLVDAAVPVGELAHDATIGITVKNIHLYRFAECHRCSPS